ncbi:MAG: hypothetical protein WKF84_11705 [Pyrinomonadaceae bacterium]
MKIELPEEVELFRDRMWRREPELRVEDASDAEHLIESVGFCATLTDARRPGPSLYIAVCGRRDAHMPRNAEGSGGQSRLDYQGRSDAARRFTAASFQRRVPLLSRCALIPHINALWGMPRNQEATKLSADALKILKVLRREWEMGTSDLRAASGVHERPRFTRTMDELQLAMKVIPGEVLYAPKFTYIWTLPEGRFPEQMKQKVTRNQAVRELARAFHRCVHDAARRARQSQRTFSVVAGLGNQALVKEGYVVRISSGLYRLANLATNGRQR